MIEYIIDERYRRMVGHDSLGMTNKYFKDNYWYKQNNKGYEGYSEYIASSILAFSNVKRYVTYEECIINGIAGCRSKNMLEQGEQLVTFARLYEYAYGGDLKNKVNSYGKLEDRINYVLDFIYEITGLDVYNYLGQILKFDMLTYDVDRHFNNLAVIRTKDGYKEAPLFDFGASFFSMQHIFTSEMTLGEKILKMTPQPFSSSFEEQALFFEKAELKIDLQKARKSLHGLSPEMPEMQEIVFSNFEKYKKIFQPRLIKKSKIR